MDELTMRERHMFLVLVALWLAGRFDLLDIPIDEQNRVRARLKAS